MSVSRHGFRRGQPVSEFLQPVRGHRLSLMRFPGGPPPPALAGNIVASNDRHLPCRGGHKTACRTQKSCRKVEARGIPHPWCGPSVSLQALPRTPHFRDHATDGTDPDRHRRSMTRRGRGVAINSTVVRAYQHAAEAWKKRRILTRRDRRPPSGRGASRAITGTTEYQAAPHSRQARAACAAITSLRARTLATRGSCRCPSRFACRTRQLPVQLRGGAGRQDLLAFLDARRAPGAPDPFASPERGDQIARRKANGPVGGRPPAVDLGEYKSRNVIERCFNLLNQFRDFATFYAKRAAYFKAGGTPAATILWLK
jgi:hypothetical protein